MPLPHLSRLERDQMKPGQSIVIRGFVTKADRFDITLSVGNRIEGPPEGTDKDNILLQLTVDMDKKKIEGNSLANGTWGKVEKFKNPFKPGEEFSLRIRAHDNHYEIFGNHRELGHYEHRQALSALSHVQVAGDLELWQCSWEGKYYSIPYEASVPGNFRPGRKLFVSAEPEKSPKNFTINLKDGANIAFHFGVRWNEKDVVRNSMRDGKWEAEERTGDFPFHKKNSFDVCIVCEPTKFQVLHDGKELLTFAHRMSPDLIDKIEISGDVQLQGVHVQ